MKAVTIATVITVIITILVAVNAITIRSMLDVTIEGIEKIEMSDTAVALILFEEEYAAFERREKFINLTVSHSDITDIDNAFADIIGAAKADDVKAMINAKSRLINSIEHLKRLSGVNIDSILLRNQRNSRISSKYAARRNIV